MTILICTALYNIVNAIQTIGKRPKFCNKVNEPKLVQNSIKHRQRLILKQSIHLDFPKVSLQTVKLAWVQFAHYAVLILLSLRHTLLANFGWLSRNLRIVLSLVLNLTTLSFKLAQCYLVQACLFCLQFQLFHIRNGLISKSPTIFIFKNYGDRHLYFKTLWIWMYV